MNPDRFRKLYKQANQIASQVDAMFQDSGTSRKRGFKAIFTEQQSHAEAIELLQNTVLSILAEPLTMKQLKALENIHWHTQNNAGGYTIERLEIGTGADFNPLIAAALTSKEFKTAAVFMGATNFYVRDVYGKLVMPIIDDAS
jgi:hypothetical protein